MTNETTKVELYGFNNDGLPVQYTVADGTAITKGAILQMTDPMTASLAVTSHQPIAGIAAESKEASDGVTRISVWKQGRFKAYASAAITIGRGVTIATHPTGNYILEALEVASGATIMGYAEETVAAGDLCLFRLNL